MKRIVQEGVRYIHGLAFSRPLPQKVAVYFHSILPVHYGAFRYMVQAFLDAGYTFTGPDAFLADPDEKTVFLSVDDNYQASHEALSLFKSCGVSLTFYLNTGYFRDWAKKEDVDAYFNRLQYDGPRYLLNRAEVLELMEAGHTIGAHTHTHRVLTALPIEVAKDEILTSKEELEHLLGTPVKHFSYPFGMRRHFNEDLRAYCASTGFETIANAIPGMQHAEQHPLSIHRSGWNLEKDVTYNWLNLKIDGRLFERYTGRSAIG